MMAWSTAHRVAHIAAVQAHHELLASPARFPVQVEAAIGRAGVPLMWQPMDQLFGTYLRVGDSHGILVNERLTRAGRRHTAAHELGHHRFGHRLDPAVPCAVDTADGPPLARRWTPDEQAAEAFADWFLMPLKAVRAALDNLGMDRPDGPADVYQLSLLLGASYRAAVRHCGSLRLVDDRDGQAWAKTSPGVLKQRLLDQRLPSTRDVDVWVVPQPRVGHSTIRNVSPGDLVVLPECVLVDSGDLVTTPNGPGQVVLTAPLRGSHTLKVARDDGAVIDFRVDVEARPHGLYRPDTAGPSSAYREVTG